MTRIKMLPEVGVKVRCPICNRESLSGLKDKEGNYIYWGGEATKKCKNCNRLVCPIHIFGGKCSDCFKEKDLGYGRGSKTTIHKEETKPEIPEKNGVWKAFGRKEDVKSE